MSKLRIFLDVGVWKEIDISHTSEEEVENIIAKELKKYQKRKKKSARIPI